MVKKLVLLDKIYNIDSKKKETEIFSRYLKYIEEFIKGNLNTTIEIKKLRNFDKRFEISIEGPEEIFIYNLLKKEIGILNNFEDIKIGDIYKGNITEPEKVGFGIFVDCGVINPNVDVLINLHKLRDQLCEKKVKSLKEILKAYGIVDHFPLHVKVISKDVSKQTIDGEIGQETLDLFNKIVNENIEAVFISGETKGQFKKALIRKGHLRDIVSIKRYSFLEHIAVFKEKTEAPGIIARIGNDLKKCKLSAIRSENIKQLLS